jgi:hypothetical protein
MQNGAPKTGLGGRVVNKREPPPKRGFSGVQGGEIYVCVYVGGVGIIRRAPGR